MLIEIFRPCVGDFCPAYPLDLGIDNTLITYNAFSHPFLSTAMASQPCLPSTTSTPPPNPFAGQVSSRGFGYFNYPIMLGFRKHRDLIALTKSVLSRRKGYLDVVIFWYCTYLLQTLDSNGVQPLHRSVAAIAKTDFPTIYPRRIRTIHEHSPSL